MRAPISTYRLQITPTWRLEHAAQLIPYLARLGADWVYLSPILESEPGSDHGYDVVDHGRTDQARGGREGLRSLAETAHHTGLGVLVDIVPNHVGVATPEVSPWWWDVLANGQMSTRAEAFDIDWDAGNGRILLPVLGDGEHELDSLKVENGELHYYDRRFPLATGTAHGSPREVHDRQNYELISWRRGDEELNYRRFFTITTLAGLRVEVPAVFAAAHIEIGHWFTNGWVDGLRIDHPDGLADPQRYLTDLAALTGDAYVVVEKILEPGESLPAKWKCHGTTGYDALALLDRLFVDPAGQKSLDDLDGELRAGTTVDWPMMTAALKRQVADTSLRAEVRRLGRLVPEIDQAEDAIAELLASFSVYRSYLPTGQEHLTHAVEVAAARRPALTSAIAKVAGRLAEVGSEISVRFQQTSGMVMAKGVEDTAFYRWSRLTSLTEVGADPSIFAMGSAEFHQAQTDRQRDWPLTMTAMSTHDTKRGEDVRARISVLAELAADWAEAVRGWQRASRFPDGPLANVVWQAAVGAWPIDRERLQAFAQKAAREAGNSTCWIDPNSIFEQHLRALVDGIFDDPDLSRAIAAWAQRLSAPGWSNSLSAKLIQLTSPGVPDVYQGTELWNLSLVDPDNRRPVDYAVADAFLTRLDQGWIPEIDSTGAAKLLVTSRALRLRRDRPDLFSGYTPLTATGSAAEHLVGFDRGGVIAMGTRLPVGLATGGGWRDTAIELPAGSWRNMLQDRQSPVWRGTVAVGALLAGYPVGLFARKA